MTHDHVKQNHSGFLTFHPIRRPLERRAAMFTNPTHISIRQGSCASAQTRVSPFGRSHCNFTTPEKLCGKYYRLQQHDRNSLNGSWSLVCRWCGRKRESFSAAQKKFLYRWRQLFPEACRASLLSIPLNCVSVWPATYSRTIGWHEIEASPEKRTLPCQARSDQFH